MRVLVIMLIALMFICVFVIMTALNNLGSLDGHAIVINLNGE